MLTKESIQVDSKPKELIASEFVIRQVAKDDDEDSGWRFQAVIRNDSSSALSDLTYALRYYDSRGHFIGLDEGFTLGSDDLERSQDKSVSIDLNIPLNVTKAVFTLKAKKTNFFEKHNFLIFGVALVVAALLLFLSDFLKKSP